MGKKRPPREVKPLKERWEIEELVFDRRTLLTLARIMKKGIVDNIDYCISTGKEANVYRAKAGEGFVAVKIYKIETTRFIKRHEYILADPRFEKIKLTDENIVYAFARKEFKNLEIAEKLGIHAPKPFYVEKNIIVMEFLGKNGLPYPLLKDAAIVDKGDFRVIVEDIAKMYYGGFAHGDISEFNILLGDFPYIIDFGQGVVEGHPKFEEFFERDVRNVVKFYKRGGINVDEKEVISAIREKRLDEFFKNF